MVHYSIVVYSWSGFIPNRFGPIYTLVVLVYVGTSLFVYINRTESPRCSEAIRRVL